MAVTYEWVGPIQRCPRYGNVRLARKLPSEGEFRTVLLDEDMQETTMKKKPKKGKGKGC